LVIIFLGYLCYKKNNKQENFKESTDKIPESINKIIDEIIKKEKEKYLHLFHTFYVY